jgi:hypothetical protein
MLNKTDNSKSQLPVHGPRLHLHAKPRTK